MDDASRLNSSVATSFTFMQASENGEEGGLGK